MAVAKGKTRLTLTFPDDVKNRLEYWSSKKSMSMAEYVIMAVERMIAHENQDYDLPTLEQARLNQLIDGMAALTSNVESLENVIISGFDSLIGLTRGDNYLIEEQGGDN